MQQESIPCIALNRVLQIKTNFRIKTRGMSNHALFTLLKVVIDMHNVIEKEQEKNIDLEYSYKVDKRFKIVPYKDIFLGIYTEGIFLVVLENLVEVNVFKDLIAGLSIRSVIEKYGEDATIPVLIQFEAKGIEGVKKEYPLEKGVYIYLTNNCNERCRHCYMYAGDIIIEEKEYTEWYQIIDELKEAGYTGVTFTGGEVTVYKGFDKLVRYAKQKGLLVVVLTNGIAWDNNLIQATYPFIDEVQISIDGYDEESYYNVRQYKGFQKALATVDGFYRLGTKVSIAVTPLAENIDSFINLFKGFAQNLMRKYPNLYIKVNHELLAGRDIFVTKEENLYYRKKLQELVNELYPKYYIETFCLNYEDGVIRENCGFGNLAIASNGDAYWCNRIHELNKSYNVFKEGVAFIDKVSSDIVKRTSVDNTKGCRECEIRYICGGVCRMEYEGIKDAETHEGEWLCKCKGKDSIYEKMLLSNEFFFK